MIKHVLQTSMERNLIVTIIYQRENKITKRNIKVFSIDGDNIKAFCFLRNQKRIFRLENILSAFLFSSVDNKIRTAVL